MASLAQLEAEPYWDREIVTSPMVGLGLQLRTAYGTGPDSVGIKGNAAHLSGGHRSQEWLKKSQYCENRSYATQSGLTGDQLLYNAALDFTPGRWGSADNRAKMRVLTKRMIDAMKAGLCDEVLEVFGTLNGTSVTGYRNDTDTGATADDSHLDHIHIRFNRRYCNDNAVMSKVAAILLGDDMAITDADAKTIARAVHNQLLGSSSVTIGMALQSTLAAVTGALPDLVRQAIQAASDDPDVEVSLTPEQIESFGAAVAAKLDIPTAQENAVAVADEEAKRLVS